MDRPAPPARRVIVIGVLGGIASGKSRVAGLLAGPGGVVLDADQFAREELSSPALAARLVEAFGPGILGPDGHPDRDALGRRVFASEEDRRRLEGWIHPAVRARIRAALAEARATGRSPVVLDVPLLLENDPQHGLVGECDFLVFVEADAAERDRRAVQGRGWQPGEVERRERLQLPLAHKRARARHILVNTGDLEELDARVAELRRLEGLP